MIITNGWIDLKERVPTEKDGELVLVWHALQGSMIIDYDKHSDNPFYAYWQTIPEDEWIDPREREPTREDSDAWNCVLTHHEIYGYKVTGWHRVSASTAYTRWRRLPKPPPGHVELRKKY